MSQQDKTLNFEATIKLESELFPGVTVSVLTPTRRRRIRYDMASAASQTKLRDLLGEREILEPECKPHREKAKTGECTCAHETILHDPEWFHCMVPGCTCRHPRFPEPLNGKLIDISKRENAVIYDELYPASVRFWVVSIEGLNISGEPATPQALIESEHDLVDEIAARVDALLALSRDEVKNSNRPTTSREQVDGPINSSTAPAADESSSIVPDLAATVESSQS